MDGLILKRSIQKVGRILFTMYGGEVITPPPTPTSEPVTVLVNSGEPGAEIAGDASGLSYETFVIMPDANGKY